MSINSAESLQFQQDFSSHAQMEEALLYIVYIAPIDLNLEVLDQMVIVLKQESVSNSYLQSWTLIM